MADTARLMSDLSYLAQWAELHSNAEKANTARRARNALAELDTERAKLVQTVSGLNRKLAQVEQQAAQLREALREAGGTA